MRTNADTFFAFHDVAVIKQANDELSQGVSFRTVLRGLLCVAAGAADVRFPARRRARQDPYAAAADAAARSRRSRHRRPRDTALAEEYFRAASALDDGDEATLEQAAAAYRKALELDPYLVAALINLANIHYSRTSWSRHRRSTNAPSASSRTSSRRTSTSATSITTSASSTRRSRCYEARSALNPRYADTHFYLAVTLEKMGLSQDARPHWRAYRQLAPNGEWVELAREFSE